MTKRKKAAFFSQQWIKNLQIVNEHTEALFQLGLLLCRQINSGRSLLQSDDVECFTLPDLNDFVKMNRTDILKMTQKTYLLRECEYQIDNLSANQWAKIFGGVALSYAKVGDLSVVAALVRSSACLGMNHRWIQEAEIYLLEQQHINGSFGLLSSEIEFLTDQFDVQECQLRLTVEVLWALADRAVLTGRQK